MAPRASDMIGRLSSRGEGSVLDRTVATALVSLIAVVVLGVVACGSDSDEPDERATGGTASISAIDNWFRPESVTVTAGSEVVWSNNGRNDHDIVPAEGDGWGIDLEDFGPGATYRYKFSDAGTYRYYCSLHGTADAGMIGVVIVE